MIWFRLEESVTFFLSFVLSFSLHSLLPVYLLSFFSVPRSVFPPHLLLPSYHPVMFLSSLPSKSPLSCLPSLFPFLCSFLPFLIMYFFPLCGSSLLVFLHFFLHSLLPVKVFSLSLSSSLFLPFSFFSLLCLVPSVFSVFFCQPSFLAVSLSIFIMSSVPSSLTTYFTSFPSSFF